MVFGYSIKELNEEALGNASESLLGDINNYMYTALEFTPFISTLRTYENTYKSPMPLLNMSNDNVTEDRLLFNYLNDENGNITKVKVVLVLGDNEASEICDLVHVVDIVDVINNLLISLSKYLSEEEIDKVKELGCYKFFIDNFLPEVNGNEYEIKKTGFCIYSTEAESTYILLSINGVTTRGKTVEDWNVNIPISVNSLDAYFKIVEAAGKRIHMNLEAIGIGTFSTGNEQFRVDITPVLKTVKEMNRVSVSMSHYSVIIIFGGEVQTFDFTVNSDSNTYVSTYINCLTTINSACEDFVKQMNQEHAQIITEIADAITVKVTELVNRYNPVEEAVSEDENEMKHDPLIKLED